MKWIVGILLVVFILICGCSSEQPVVETETTIVTPTPVAVTATWIQTVGPTPTPTNDIAECYNHSVTTYPEYCYNLMYWVKPIPTPTGMGYTAKVWQNNGCIQFNKTSRDCERWGDDSWMVLFMKNLTVVRNLSYINNTEMVSAVVFYNKSFDLNVINNNLTFSDFINTYWDKTYPTQPYDKNLFTPDLNATAVPIDTFNPDGF